MTKYFFRIALLISVFAAGSANAADSVLYLKELGNIPLMPGVSVVENSGIVFDKPEGRIAEAVLVTDKSPESFVNYYAESLPPLGWNRTSPVSFTDDNGKLTFEITVKQGRTYITARLIPPEK